PRRGGSAAGHGRTTRRARPADRDDHREDPRRDPPPGHSLGRAAHHGAGRENPDLGRREPGPAPPGDRPGRRRHPPAGMAGRSACRGRAGMKRWPARLRDHWLLGMIGVVPLVLLLTVSAHIFLWASIPYRGYGASYAMIDIPEGTAAARAIEILEEHGVIQRSPLALVYLRLTGRTHGLKAGEYSFTRPMTPGEVFDKMISG